MGQLSLGGMVELRGVTAEPAVALRELDIFVLPSLSEACSNALLQAMATGLAVVATRVGGPPAWSRTRKRGSWCAPGDREALARAVIRLVEEPALADRLGCGGALHDAAHGSATDRMIDRFRRVYARIAGRGLRPFRCRRDMCGIAGRFNLDGRPVDPGWSAAWPTAVTHRGPDEDGAHVAGPSASPIGGSRSSTSTGGSSRSRNEDGTVSGRLQRRDLQLSWSCAASSSSAVIASRTRTDTEVIVHLYEDFGAGLPRAPATGCSRSRCGTSGGDGCCWRATGWARSRSTTPIGRASAFSSAPS